MTEEDQRVLTDYENNKNNLKNVSYYKFTQKQINNESTNSMVLS